MGVQIQKRLKNNSQKKGQLRELFLKRQASFQTTKRGLKAIKKPNYQHHHHLPKRVQYAQIARHYAIDEITPYH